MTSIRPLGDRVLVESFKEEEVTASGIVLPETMEKEKKAQGKIVALGTGEELAKLGLKIGDLVVYEKWGGEEVKVGGLLMGERGLDINKRLESYVKFDRFDKTFQRGVDFT
jgi:chaperonin GroES